MGSLAKMMRAMPSSLYLILTIDATKKLRPVTKKKTTTTP
jgi:hypothetical protein